jgi:hypothetical protein
MNDIVFTKGQGGLGTALPGKDHYAALIFYSDTKPSSWGDNDTREIVSLSAAEALGITDDSLTDIIKVIHYHLKRFFAVYTLKGIAPKLFLTIADVPATTYDFAEVTNTQNFAGGEIRTMGIYVNIAYTSTLINSLQTAIAALDALHKPCSVIASFDYSAVTDWTTAADLRALTDSKVSVTIGQDGGGEGADLYDDVAKTISDLGSILAWASIKQVHENIGWVVKFNAAFDGEFDVPALANGALVSANEAVLDGLNTKGYLFLKKHVGVAGSYFNDSHTAVVVTSDYAYLERNQTIDKAIRGVYSYLIQQLNMPVLIDPDSGKLDELAVGFLENEGSKALNQMISDGELSGASVTIDPDQDVLSTSTIEVIIALVPIGVARTISVKIQFSTTV